MAIGTQTIKLGETGTFDEPNTVLGSKFTIFNIPSVHAKFVSGTINSLFVVVLGDTIKYDFDILLFKDDLTTGSVVENKKELVLSAEDALKCFAKIRVENNGNLADDYLNPVGGHYFAGLFNLHIPFSAPTIYGIAVYQDGENSYTLNNATYLTFNYDGAATY
jgi:hypothetical protein